MCSSFMIPSPAKISRQPSFSVLTSWSLVRRENCFNLQQARNYLVLIDIRWLMDQGRLRMRGNIIMIINYNLMNLVAY